MYKTIFIQLTFTILTLSLLSISGKRKKETTIKVKVVLVVWCYAKTWKILLIEVSLVYDTSRA